MYIVTVEETIPKTNY